MLTEFSLTPATAVRLCWQFKTDEAQRS